MDQRPPPDATSIAAMLRGVAGLAIGGAAGFAIYVALLQQGLDALALPAANAGLGCGLMSGRKSVPLAVLAGMVGLGLGLFAEWYTAPFNADGSWQFFLTHAHELRTGTWIMIVLGSLAAAWFGLGRQRIRHVRQEQSAQ